MYRSLVWALFVSLFSSAAAAEARNPLHGTAAKLVFVSETQFPGKGGNQALCARVLDWHFLYIPLRRTVTDYVFSNDHCTDTNVHPIPAERIAMFKAAGILPAHVTDKPSVPLLGAERNKAAILIATFAILGIPLFMRQRMRIAAHRTLRKSGDPMFYDILLTLLFHTAQRDGVIDKTDLQAIIRTYKETSGTTATPEMAAEKFTLTLPDDVVLNLVKDYRSLEAAVLIDAAIRVATHRGRISREKRALITRLTEVLDGDLDQVRMSIENALDHKASASKPILQPA